MFFRIPPGGRIPAVRTSCLSPCYKNHAVRTEKWRYIQYADGSEELYDHENDPYEWTNLAGDRQYADVIREHARWLPKTNAAPAKGGNGVKKKKAKTKAKKSL